jgi:hypothetical protein
VIVDRDNNSASGENAEDENLTPAWAKTEDQSEREVEKAALDMFQSNEEPRRGLEPLRIDLIEDRFEYLSGRKLVKEEWISPQLQMALTELHLILRLTVSREDKEKPIQPQTAERRNSNRSRALVRSLGGIKPRKQFAG